MPYKGFRKNAITQKVIGIFLICKNYVKENVVGYIIRPNLFLSEKMCIEIREPEITVIENVKAITIQNLKRQQYERKKKHKY